MRGSLLPVTSVLFGATAMALGTPLLWARISFLKPSWVPELVHRSASTPLAIYHDVGRSYLADKKGMKLHDQFVHTLQQVWHRTAYLDVSLRSHHLTGRFLDVLRSSGSNWFKQIASI